MLQQRSDKVVGLKGRRHIASLSSVERAEEVTVVTCMSTSGKFVSLLFGLPKEEYEIGFAGVTGNHSREGRSMNKVRVVRTTKKRGPAFAWMTQTAMAAPSVRFATKNSQKTRKARNGCVAQNVPVGAVKAVQMTAAAS
jgi:hypothetical protein